jgi:hypothetical protein
MCAAWLFCALLSVISFDGIHCLIQCCDHLDFWFVINLIGLNIDCITILLLVCLILLRWQLAYLSLWVVTAEWLDIYLSCPKSLGSCLTIIVRIYSDDYTNRYYNNPSTYPGMSSPDRAQKFYTNPTNPYYDPLWSQGYADRRSPSNLRQDGFYDDPYGAWGYEGMGGYGGMYGRGMGPGRRLYAVSTGSGERKKRGLNQNRLMG